MPVGIMPDVQAIQRIPGSELNEINDRISRGGWVLLQILVERVAKNKTFQDQETYIIGLKRGTLD